MVASTFLTKGAGSLTQLSVTGATANYLAVQSDDGDTSYVASLADGAGEEDLYTLQNPSNFGMDTNAFIQGLKLYWNGKSQNAYLATIQSVLLTGGSSYYGTAQTPGTSYALYSDAWSTNPKTGKNWTVADITDLQVGFIITDGQHSSLYYPGRITYLYVYITWIAGNWSTLAAWTKPTQSVGVPH
jgi:hypothetical protein